MKKKDFVLVIGVEKHYLTEEQAKFYLRAVETGMKIIKLDDGRIFGPNLQSLMHKNQMKGQWLCESGTWHEKEAKCFCNGDWIKGTGGLKFVPNKVHTV